MEFRNGKKWKFVKVYNNFMLFIGKIFSFSEIISKLTYK